MPLGGQFAISDELRQQLPLEVVPGISLCVCPEWIRNQKTWDGSPLESISKHSLYALICRYEAVSTEEKQWDDKIKRVGIALWIARPCGITDSLVVHGKLEDGYNTHLWSTHSPFAPNVAYHSYHFKERDLLIAQRISKPLLALLKGSVRVSLANLYMALHQDLWDIRYMLLWASLEALFAPPDGELSFRISQRLAKFLKKKPSAAKIVFAKAKRCYDIRSKIVHGQFISLGERESKLLLLRTELFVRNSMRAILLDETLLSTFTASNRDKFLNDICF